MAEATSSVLTLLEKKAVLFLSVDDLKALCGQLITYLPYVAPDSSYDARECSSFSQKSSPHLTNLHSLKFLSTRILLFYSCWLD